MHVSLPATAAPRAIQIQAETAAMPKSTPVVTALLAGATKDATAIHKPTNLNSLENQLLIHSMAERHAATSTLDMQTQASKWTEQWKEFYNQLSQWGIKPGSEEFVQLFKNYSDNFDRAAGAQVINKVKNVIAALATTRLGTALAAKYPGLEAEIERVALTPHPDERHAFIIDKLAAGEALGKSTDVKNADEAYQRYTMMAELLAKYNFNADEKHQVLVYRYATRVRTMIGSGLKFGLELIKDPTKIINLLKDAWSEIQGDKAERDKCLVLRPVV